MAAEWIKIRLDLADDPAVFLLSDILSIECPTVVGHLVTFWSWLDRHTSDGMDIKATDNMIDAKVGCQGFAQALRKVNWLDGEPMTLFIPLFERHNGASSKARALEAEAKRIRRAGKKSDKNSPTNVGHMSDKNTPECQTRGEERRGDIKPSLSSEKLSTDFVPTPETVEYLLYRRLPRPTQANIAAFESHHEQKRTHFRDERERQAAFRKWMANEKSFQNNSGGSREKRTTAAHVHAEATKGAFT